MFLEIGPSRPTVIVSVEECQTRCDLFPREPAKRSDEGSVHTATCNYLLVESAMNYARV